MHSYKTLSSLFKLTKITTKKDLAFGTQMFFQQAQSTSSTFFSPHRNFHYGSFSNSNYRHFSISPNKTPHKHANRYIGSAYEVSFRCPKEERQNFHASRCLIPISVGQEVHEGDRLKDTLAAVSNAFSSCVLMVDDSIQAATKMINEDMRNDTGEHQWQRINANVIHAILEGDNWLFRNRQLIESQITIPMRIVRWYEWRTDPDFNKAINDTRIFYDENEQFRNAVDQNVSEFLGRYENNHLLTESYVRKRAEWFCREYLLEECAVMMHLWPKLGCEYEVYPNGRNSAMQAAFDLSIKQRFSNLLKPVALRFHKIQSKLESSGINLVGEDSTTEEIDEKQHTIKVRI